MAFASTTTVPVERTKAEIEKIVRKAGATTFGFMDARGEVRVIFEMQNRTVRFTMAMPADLPAQKTRSRWRALLLVIKAKLESWEAGVESWEEAFLAQIVVPGKAGRTVYEETRESIAYGYQSGEPVALLPPPPSLG